MFLDFWNVQTPHEGPCDLDSFQDPLAMKQQCCSQSQLIIRVLNPH